MSSPPDQASSDVFSFLRDGHAELLSHFSRNAWQTNLIQQADSFEYIELGDYFPAFRGLLKGVLRDPHPILVRNEYRVALEALQQSEYRHGAYVIGQPGIGKSLFVIYLIVRLLNLKMSVALQLPSDIPFYALFTETGFSVHPRTNARPLIQHSPTWALCDCNYDATYPNSVFLGEPDQIRVVQVTSPTASNWKAWSKHVGAKPFIMDIWTVEELKALAGLLRVDAKRMAMLANRWGGVPRTLLPFISKPEGDEEADRYFHGIANQAVEHCPKSIQQGIALNLSDTPPSAFFFVRPLSSLNSESSRSEHYICIPTAHLCLLLAEGLSMHTRDVKLALYSTLREYPGTHSAAGDIFEGWFHEYAQTLGRYIACHWLLQNSEGRTTLTFLRRRLAATKPTRHSMLPGTPNLIRATQSEGVDWTTPLYWAPFAKIFAGIDSVLVVDGEVFAIQVTIATRHVADPNPGLEKLAELFPDNLQNMRWSLLFIGPEEEQIRGVAQPWVGKAIHPKLQTPMRVGWAALDPVGEDVGNKIFYDYSPPVPEQMAVS